MRFERKASNKKSWWQPQTDETPFCPDWSERLKTVCFKAYRQHARNLEGEFDFRVVMTLEEAAWLISELADSALRNAPDALEAALTGKADDLVRLLACASGLKPVLPPKKADEYVPTYESESWEEPRKVP